jgi:hypothetical protein
VSALARKSSFSGGKAAEIASSSSKTPSLSSSMVLVERFSAITLRFEERCCTIFRQEELVD